jgi:hypothetical protein
MHRVVPPVFAPKQKKTNKHAWKPNGLDGLVSSMSSSMFILMFSDFHHPESQQDNMQWMLDTG